MLLRRRFEIIVRVELSRKVKVSAIAEKGSLAF